MELECISYEHILHVFYEQKQKNILQILSFLTCVDKSCSLSGRLQHVMQCEKDRDTYFLEKSQTHAASSGKRPNCVSPVSCLFLTFSSAVNSGAESFIDVRILSSSLEAKLTVCFCALHGDEEVLELTIVHLLNRRLKV